MVESKNPQSEAVPDDFTSQQAAWLTKVLGAGKLETSLFWLLAGLLAQRDRALKLAYIKLEQCKAFDLGPEGKPLYHEGILVPDIQARKQILDAIHETDPHYIYGLGPDPMDCNTCGTGTVKLP